MMEYTSSNGANITINASSFGDALLLKKEAVKIIKKSNIDIASIDLDFKNLKIEAIQKIINILLEADSNDDFEKAVFNCLKRCKYNDLKITRDTFEEIEARENYYEIVTKCIIENLSPFIKPLVSLYTQQVGTKPTESPEQK
jgi:hypothetical protein